MGPTAAAEAFGFGAASDSWGGPRRSGTDSGGRRVGGELVRQTRENGMIMNSLPLLAAAGPNWVSSWLTPFWLMGVGALVGLTLLLAAWLVLLGLSRIPWMAALDNSPRVRLAAICLLAVVLYAVLCPLMLGAASSSAADEGSGRSPASLAVSLLMLAPVALVLSFVIVRLASPKLAVEIPMVVREGVLWPLLMLFLSLACFGVVGVVAVADPGAILASLRRVPYVGEQTMAFEIPGAPEVAADDELAEPPSHPIKVSFRRSELRRLVFRCDDNVTVTADPRVVARLSGSAIEVPAGEPLAWSHHERKETPFPAEEVTSLYVRHRGAQPTTLRLTVVTEPPQPEVAAIGYVAAFIVALFVLYLLQHATVPKASAVALSTLKSEIAQPLFLILLALGFFFLALSNFIPYHTFGEDIKMLKDSGLTLIMVLCIIQAVWAAGTSIAEEIEGRTALTVLSKPITRRSFVLGKFLGIVWTVGLMFVLLGLVFLIVLAYKPIYDSRETSQAMPEWQLTYAQVASTAPGLALAFMETVVLASLSVAISTRLPLLANFVICFAIYVLGHLTPLIVQSSVEGFEIVKFVGRLIATVFPNLEHFNIQAAVAAGVTVPFEYLAWSLVYCLIYALIAMLLALAMFEDRDLA